MIQNFLPKPHEIIEQSIMFNESLRGFGYKCKVLIPTNIDLPEEGYQQNIGYDDSASIDLYIQIDPHPKPKLLQSLGWISEDEDTKPMLCYMSRYIQPTNEVRKVNSQSIEILPIKYTKLILEYDYENAGKEFIVTKVSANSFNPVYYILMIVPYRPVVPKNPNPLQDNNLERLDVQEEDNSFRFLGKNRSRDVNIKY